jgi:hypothetical protein
MSQSNITSITDYAGLNVVLKQTENNLQNKVTETNWLRYVFRRIPLYSAIGLIFFSVCLAMAMIDKIGFNVVDQFLKQFISFDFNWGLRILISSLFLMLVLTPISKRKVFNKEIEGLALWVKLSANALFITMFMSGFSVIISGQYRLYLGLAAFSVVTLSAMLMDRTLGFTRRNERYQLFASRAEGLQILFASREALKIPFAESHLLELAKFYEELRLSKHNDTISDSHYLLAQFEQLKGALK